MEDPSVMDHVTSAGAGAALTTPWWLTALNPWLQTLVLILSAAWLLMQMYRFAKKKGD
jgi:membrane protein implicated in regulation of membrane protease activity